MQQALELPHRCVQGARDSLMVDPPQSFVHSVTLTSTNTNATQHPSTPVTREGDPRVLVTSLSMLQDLVYLALIAPKL